MFDLKMKVMEKIHELLDYFDISEYEEIQSRLTCACPVHDGDNNLAWNINVDPDSDHYGIWFCNTAGCHKKKGHDVIALTHLLMEKRLKKACSFQEVISFLEKFTAGVVARKFTYVKDNYLKLLQRSTKIKAKTGFRREDVRKRLVIPAKYYLDRNFSADALNYFDVGLCLDQNSQFYRRVVFTVYDENDEYAVGFVGRATVEGQEKWINKKGFNKANYLFNYGKAIKKLEKTDTIVVVEGQGDVIRLWESGIENCVGIFGSSLSDSQEFLLQRSGAMNIVTIMDNDQAGEKCRQEIQNRLSSFFNIFHINPTKKDVGEMTVEEIEQIIKPQLKGKI